MHEKNSNFLKDPEVACRHGMKIEMNQWNEMISQIDCYWTYSCDSLHVNFLMKGTLFQIYDGPFQGGIPLKFSCKQKCHLNHYLDVIIPVFIKQDLTSL